MANVAVSSHSLHISLTATRYITDLPDDIPTEIFTQRSFPENWSPWTLPFS